MPGLGVFSNASSIAGLGIGFMAMNIPQLIALYILIAAVMMLQRRFLDVNVNYKTKRIVIGLVVFTIAAVLVSGGFFYKNAFEVLVSAIEGTASL